MVQYNITPIDEVKPISLGQLRENILYFPNQISPRNRLGKFVQNGVIEGEKIQSFKILHLKPEIGSPRGHAQEDLYLHVQFILSSGKIREELSFYAGMLRRINYSSK